MHTLHIDMGREMRGGQHQVLLLLDTLRKAGHSFTLLSPLGSPLLNIASELGFNVQPASPRKIRQLSLQYDIVHAHDARSHTLAALFSRCPFVVSRRVAFPVRRGPISRWKYRRPARFLAVSNFVSGKLQEAGVPQSKIDVVYDSVPPAAMQSWKADSPVIALATGDPQKGRDLIERSSEIMRLPITFSNDLAKDFANASAFVYITRSEGLGSAALLAMSMGVPVIASRVDGMVEVFEDGVSGIAVENEPHAIVSAIQQVRGNPELAARLISAGRQRVESLFSPSTLMINTLASYRRALAI